MRAQGFTLTELLLTLALLLILAAFLFPNLYRARGRAVDLAAQAYAREVYRLALLRWVETNNPLPSTDCAQGVELGDQRAEPLPGTVGECILEKLSIRAGRC